MRHIELPVDEVAPRYLAGESTRTLARAYGVGRTTIGKRLHAAGVTMHPRGAPFGNQYSLGHKNHLGQHKRGGPLYVSNDGYLVTRDREGRKSYVHRGCWEAYRGAIPKGHVIHHGDEDRQHNTIENLECMPNGEHSRVHKLA